MLCDPMGCGPQGSSLHRIVQARTLEWIAISSPRGSSRFRDLTHISYGSCAADRFFTTELPRKPFKLLIACCFCIIFKWPGAYIALQFSSVLLCPTLWPHWLQHNRLLVHHQLPEFTQTHVHWVGDAIQPSHPLLSPFPPAFNLSHHQGLFQWVSSSHQVAKVLEFQLQHQSFQWPPRTDFL